MAGDDAEDEWRFSVDDFDDGPEEGASGDQRASPEGTGPHPGRTDDEAAEGDDEEANVAGEFAPEVPVVPEMPDPENAAFVILGSVLTILALASVIGGPSFGMLDALVIVVVVGGLGALVYSALVRLTPEA